MTIVDAERADLQTRIAALENDRDYWRDQHDLVMQDWRADIAAWSADHPDPSLNQNAYLSALADLLRFFNPATGAVATRLGQDFLGDAFAKAHRLYVAARAPAPTEPS